ncbi:metal ABC transporter substrate-binding protein [Streptomyces lonegramiae]|uniref:Metal ABC transporter substrate-binding protein n=1 Tax=Streptomyces lonegramiae TaxID=3075524 RepID=A0ABU2XAR1_9ACTN|nr:metal ABC transporter substrate-binding protein [Streptomyces sp. DSM 41529]MDT0542215.1 metal ABC transporter substrate-binding protein [Streptomyces sp. DSM 41529]
MNIRRPILPAAVAGVAVLGLATALTACSAHTTDGRTDGKLDVVASFYPMQFLAERIGGGHVHVSSLTKPGTEPHDLDISARQTADLSKAGLVVYLKGLQPAVDAAVKQAEPKHVAEASSYTSLEDHGTEVAGDEHGHDEHGEGEHGHSGEDAGSDPHIWLDPVRYAQVAEGVGKALEKADPDHAAAYKKNTAALVKQLGALNDDFRTGLKNRASDTFITTHAAFGYLAERYGLRQEAISGIDPESEPSPARVKDLHEITKKDKVGTVFFETLVSDKTAKTLAGDLGLRTDVLDPIEGISGKSKGRDYFEVMHANLKALEKALGTK